jgi:hypothetical protein
MAYEHKPGMGSAFKNKYKEDGDNKPTLTGEMMNLDGSMVRVAIWFKADRNGDRYASIKIEPPRESQGAGTGGGGTSLPSASPKRDMDDDIPF